MVTTIEKVLDALNTTDSDVQIEKFLKMVLEAIAVSNDNNIMTELMLDMLQKNASMNTQMTKQMEEIKRLSVTDALTGLYNRRKFIEELEKEVNRSSRYKTPFGIIMFDIDHFKHVNDTYGHDVGDSVLKELSSLVKNRLRSVDVLTRWGGEEFIILVTAVNQEETMNLAEDIRKNIEDYDFKYVPRVTCSFGVVVSENKDIQDTKDITKNVDIALYQAKEAGRNVVIMYE